MKRKDVINSMSKLVEGELFYDFCTGQTITTLGPVIARMMEDWNQKTAETKFTNVEIETAKTTNHIFVLRSLINLLYMSLQEDPKK